MRKYRLVSSKARTTVDLRDYTSTIEEAVREVIPTATVEVCENYYIVSPAPSKGQAIKIGRSICQSSLAQHCVQIPKLFISVEITNRTKEETQNEAKNQQHNGGHF